MYVVLRLVMRWEVVECFLDAVLQIDRDLLWQAARSQGVDCLVAPYEADAQLAYLNKAGIVQAIVTEDSDLLAFGCKKVLDYNYHMLLYVQLEVRFFLSRNHYLIPAANIYLQC